jgi:hypothetical protein
MLLDDTVVIPAAKVKILISNMMIPASTSPGGMNLPERNKHSFSTGPKEANKYRESDKWEEHGKPASLTLTSGVERQAGIHNPDTDPHRLTTQKHERHTVRSHSPALVAKAAKQNIVNTPANSCEVE